ncbi:signal recognition particle protein [Spiroplasma sabaudiense Ar-1343]|uniref:Signal recognition particle protein n=1 Tax=Spiroplasma sabaudiense Ar-1343 TaxID=1276257 RepID=W6AIY9_9MOLU|nr:signal recognition particle protein [Spiroplasma sabaudiense]AHI53674.1 signal recognition particle protein [Spiroplasma sabaudiense Ar-1343]
MGFGDFLANRMKKSIEKNMRKSTLTEDNIKDTLREIRLTLIEADVNLEVVKSFIKKIEAKATGQYIAEGVRADQQMVKLVHEELTEILGKVNKGLEISKRPSVIMMVGLQGAGKTTSVGKLAHLIDKKYNKKALMVGLDIYRPGAIDQLVEIGAKNNIATFERGKNDPIKTAKESIEYAQKEDFDVVILDTSGRLQIDKPLMKELNEIRKATSPQEILIVVDGMTGQDIINVTSEFNDLLKLSGVIVTKLDGDARGGATLSITSMTKLPVKFIGEGEGISALSEFHPKRMADRILGMGDVDTLFEKAVEVVDQRTMEKTMKRMFMGQFDLEDLRNQLAQVAKMGNLGGVMKMIPGAQKISESQLEAAQKKLFTANILMNSMTLKERREPRVLKAINRKNRIIKGSGRTEKEYNELLQQFDKGKKQVMEMTKQLKSGRMPNLKGMGGKGFGGGMF